MVDQKDFFDNYEDNLTLLTSFSTRRSGSTKLFNLFRASALLLELKTYEIKIHPNSITPELINELCKKKIDILLLSQRSLNEQIVSFSRVFNIKNKFNKTNKIYEYAKQKIIEEREQEFCILRKIIPKAVNICLARYEYINNINIKNQLVDCCRILYNVLDLDLSLDNIKHLINSNNILEKLDYKYGLTKKSAIRIQSKYIGNFLDFDSFSQIHGGHISGEEDYFDQELLSIVSQDEYDSEAKDIDRIYKSNISNLLKQSPKNLSVYYLE